MIQQTKQQKKKK